MNTFKLISVLCGGIMLAACATQPRNVGSLDASINEATQDDYGQFLYHQSLAMDNLAYVRKVRQYAQDDHYWNIDFERGIRDAAARAAEHTRQAQEAMARWHDNCDRHTDICKRVHDLEGMHISRLLPVAYFDSGNAVPQSIVQAHVDDILHMARDFPDLSLDIFGQTDSVGSSRANKQLAARRAHAVNDLLISQGLPASVHVHQIAVGEAPGPDNTANADNRRVDVLVYRHGEAHRKMRHRH